MSSNHASRREFLKTSAGAAAAGVATPYFFTGEQAWADDAKSAGERPVIGCIGTGSRWGGVGRAAMRYGDVAAVCDVDELRARKGQAITAATQKKTGSVRDVERHEEYRKILDRKDIDVVTIVTPDHWHTKIAIEAMQAGKDVYCEKPLTLTIEEGKQIAKVQKETGRVFQVGTQQRSEMGLRFLKAVALVHDGRLGKIKRVQCAIGGSPRSGPLKTAEPPSHLNWEMWLGQTPLVDYIPRRCHYEFRWWYEYSGGKMTDWGAHHVDIAQWAIDQNGPDQGPTSVAGVEGTVQHPVPLKNGYPVRNNEYNAATKFQVQAMFPGDVEMVIRHDTSNGVTIVGEKATIFVSRGTLRDVEGTLVKDLKDNPLSDELLTKLYKGKKPGGGHMRNFFECVKDRSEPVSDVHSHHRALTTCHLANIAIRLGRKLKWDPKAQQIVGDEEANKWQSREQREGYEIKV